MILRQVVAESETRSGNDRIIISYDTTMKWVSTNCAAGLPSQLRTPDLAPP